jgi:Flp pilus assembly protein TadG
MRTQRGQSTVELVLIMPLLAVLLFLIFEVGRLFGSWLLITNAAREGARYAAVQCVPTNTAGLAVTCTAGTDPTSSIAQQVQTTASFLAVQTSTACTVSGNTITVPSGQTSCVAVTYSTDASGNGDGIVIVRVAYNVQTLMPITGNVPFLGAINYPGSQQVTATSTMRLEQ